MYSNEHERIFIDFKIRRLIERAINFQFNRHDVIPYSELLDGLIIDEFTIGAKHLLTD